jgi:LacI family transcriptional regulator
MTTRRRVTLRNIAEAAGVATGTVSMVINRSPLVAEATRARVLAVIRDLGYVYDRGAAQLRSKRTNIVGTSMCDLLNPYFAEIVAGIEQSLSATGRMLFLGNSGESAQRQAQFLDTLREYNVDGIALMPAMGTPRAAVARVQGWGIPLVMVSRYVAGIHADYVGSDNRLATALATRHLLGLGHERIAFVGFNRRTSTARDRTAGFRATMAKAGKAIAAGHVVECDPTRAEGFRAVEALFGRDPAPSAVVCFNDLLAFGVMLGLRHRGLEPGRDCSVVGTDDVAESALWHPALTTVAMDTAQIGEAAGQLLRARIERPDRPVERIVCTPRLVVRASSGEAPRRAGGKVRRRGAHVR